jgi:hypothetical protein
MIHAMQEDAMKSVLTPLLLPIPPVLQVLVAVPVVVPALVAALQHEDAETVHVKVFQLVLCPPCVFQPPQHCV